MNEILPFCFGTYKQSDKNVLMRTIDEALKANIRLFDTAPSYHTEKILAKSLRNSMVRYGIKRHEIYLIDKIDAWQMQKGDIKRTIEIALSEMGMDYIDVLLIHWPIPEFFFQTWQQMISLKEIGLVKNIGVCNVRVRQLQELIKEYNKPDFVQVERHPLWTCKKDIDFFLNNQIKVMTYSPLCRMDVRLASSPTLKKIADKYGKTIGQVILRWHIESKCIPVFSSHKVERIQENINIFDFSLDPKEISEIDNLNQDLKISLESWGCPGF